MSIWRMCGDILTSEEAIVFGKGVSHFARLALELNPRLSLCPGDAECFDPCRLRGADLSSVSLAR